jgi:hypothetical protein
MKGVLGVRCLVNCARELISAIGIVLKIAQNDGSSDKAALSIKASLNLCRKKRRPLDQPRNSLIILTKRPMLSSGQSAAELKTC